jgi:hypothetical protein
MSRKTAGAESGDRLPQRSMKHIQFIIASLVLTILLWSWMSWPLPVHATSGIPASPHRTEANPVRTMIAGDHLQFLYHLWLARDTLLLNTPLFYNLYEFNAGDDEACYATRKYYLPFSLFFTAGCLGGNQAIGWNVTGLLALWISFVFTWLLARRYARGNGETWLAACLATSFPYRWITLMGGSPTGLAMMWVPMILYGIDTMVRDRRAGGALLAGVSIYFAGWSDPHVLFFGALAAPCWGLVCWLHTAQRIFPHRRDLLSLLRAAWPLGAMVLLILLQARGVQTNMEDTHVADSGRRLISEVAIFSPSPAGILSTREQGMSNHIYVGLWTTMLAALAALAAGWRLRKGDREQWIGRVVPAGLLLTGMVGLVILSLGTRNPGGTLWWLRLVKVLPPFGMIRQSAKIFVLLPSLLAVFLVMTLPHLLDALRVRRAGGLVYTAILLTILLDYGARINPTICKLDRKQEAYRAVKAHADATGRRAHVLGIPLWPGDSHWTSLNQYYVSLYRIRMMNGYRPTVRKTYMEDVYLRFESFNKGGYADAQLDELERRGIHYLVLHEDAFPEKVSPFPVSHTLYSLLEHPRIRLLAHDGPVWAFELVKGPGGSQPPLTSWPYRFPTRLWQAERAQTTGGDIRTAVDTSGTRYVRLTGPDSSLTTSTYPLHGITNVCYLVRTRGSSRWNARAVAGAIETVTTIEGADSDGWTWHRIPVPVHPAYSPLQMHIEPDTGVLDVDLAILGDATWPVDGLAAPLVLPAPLFFHAGYTDPETGDVVLDADRESADVIFYGPKLPLPAGSYRITMDYRTEAPAGTVLGTLKSRYPSGLADPTPVVAGEPAVLDLALTTNLRLAIDFAFARQGDIRIRHVIIAPMESEAARD